jgi:hypothetical protein
MQSEKCRFKHNLLYWDFDLERFVEFKCSESAKKDGFCVFHHPEYWKDNEKQLRERFYEKVERVRRNGKKLLCIGYNLPSMEVEGEFKSAVYFSWAKFHGKADFSHANFFKEACFPNAEFFDQANFSHAHFSGVTDFFCAKFFGRTTFYRANFSERAFFTELRKGSEGDQTFSTEDLLNDAKLKSISALRKEASQRDPTLFFTDVEFDKPESVRFNGFDLTNTSFLHTDVSRINIGENVSWGSDRRIFDERLADMGERGVTHDVVATVYRRLRQNLESKMRYTEAGRFFIGEMECKRKSVKIKSFVLRWIRTNVLSALAWYKYMSNYGESYSRVFLWILLTPTVAAILATIAQTQHQFMTSFSQNLQNHYFAFFQLKTDNVVELALRIISLLLMGQLYISLRRRFERRYKG